jgi:UDP-N-acetylmuramyl pentapeptide phosphotransferase/UDP-N-acetylglucosamine-1-phosphate transferase
MIASIIAPFLFGACCVFFLGWPACAALRRFGVIDKPNARSSHAVPTVRGGGVAIILTLLGAVVGLAWTASQRGLPLAPSLALGAAVLALAVVSFCDDLRSVGARIRFGCHAGAAIAVLVFVGLPQIGAGEAGSLALALVGFLWIAGYTNAFNFMDGINGLAAGQAAVTGAATAALALAAGVPVHHPLVWLALVVAGAAAGFLPHNFPRARMFMGDVSSAPLGFLLAALGWWLACEAGWWILLPVGLLHANFVLDTGVTLARRVARGERWYEAHREHFYQRLIRSGHSHAYVTGWQLGFQLVIAVAVVAAVRAGGGWWLLPVTLVVALVWAVLFLQAERCFRVATTGRRH